MNDEMKPDKKPQPKTKMWKKFLRWSIQIVILGAICFFLARTVIKNWEQVRDFQWNFNPWFLILSFVALGVTLFYMIVLWRGLLMKLGGSVGLPSAIRIFAISSMGRYLPGKVWQIAGMVYLGQKEGVRAETGVWAAVLAQILAVLAGILFFFVSLIVEPQRILLPFMKSLGVNNFSPYWLLLPVLLVLILIHPRILKGVTNWLLRILKREPLEFNLSYIRLLSFFLLYVLSWFFYGITFYLFVSSIHPIPLTDWFVIAGSFAAAYIVGLLALFVPGGLGVREGILALFLAGLVGSGVAVAISFGQRLWFTIIELTFVLIAVIFMRRKNVKEETDEKK